MLTHMVASVRRTMKTSITGFLAHQALASLREARVADKERAYERVVPSCVIAQMLLALVLEGTANEIADQQLSKWVAKRLESSSTEFKWWFLSGREGRTPFEAGAEPIQTVSDLNKIRNEIAHPKVHDFGNEIIIQDINRDIQRNVPGDQLIRPGDRLAMPTMQLHDDHGYNYEMTLVLLKRTMDAVINLRHHVGIEVYFYADNIKMQIAYDETKDA
jgi:hypothetical protein